MKLRKATLFLLAIFCYLSSFSQRQMEKLNHGLVAVKTSSGVFISWRTLSSEMKDVAFNLYRDGTKINSEPIDGASDYVDASGNVGDKYEVRATVKGNEISSNDTASVWAQNYLDIPLRKIDGGYSTYTANDATVADLDGDGQYEIIVKRLANDLSENSTDYNYLEAYKLDGTFLWAINLGPNMYNQVECNFLVWDMDGDGKAEVMARTSEGMVDGEGNQIGDVDGDHITNYRAYISQYNSLGYRYRGPDFLSIFDGQTGKELDRVNYIPREPISQWGLPGQNTGQLAHRSTKCMYTVAYLDGKTPSIVVSRGIYEKIALEAWNFQDGKLMQEWHFDSDQAGNFPYAKQGYHNLTQGDVDDDGRDEIMYGSMCVDDNGKGLYSTELGHGDALHLADINPDRKGLEFFACLENKTGGDYRDARTGEIFFYKSIGRDMGRAGCADITPDYPGMEMWGPNDFPFLSSTGKEITNLTPPSSMNFFIWWDGDPLREMLDHAWYGDYGIGTITKYNNGANTQLLLATGTRSDNWTKGNPCVSADILGDWREEVIWRTADNSALRLYTTTDPTDLKIYTLMQDPQYRAAIGWQPNSYNQPPHPSFFIGDGMDSIPPAPIMMPGQKVFTSGKWDLNTTTSWDDQGSASKFQDGDSVLFDISGNYADTVELSGDLKPADLRIISPYNYTLAGTGAINGTGDLTKAGSGKAIIENNCNLTGITRVWDGELIMNGMLSSSPVFVKRFATFGGNGHLNKGLTLEKYSNLIVSDSTGLADTLFIKNGLTIYPNTSIFMDLSNDTSGVSKTNDLLIIDGDLTLKGATTININSINDTLSTGTYTLAKVSGSFEGNLDNISVSGLSGTAFSLEYNNGELQLVVPETRAAGTIIWQGALDNEWDIFNKKNWLKNGVADYFIGNDSVIFNDQAIKTSIKIIGPYTVGGLLFDASKSVTIYGDGLITGNASLTKRGSGKFTLMTPNTFTGKTTIEEGIVSIPEITNGGTASGIGAATADAKNLTIDGGALEIRNPGNMLSDRGITVGANNGTIKVASSNAIVTLGTSVAGSGYLVKDGYGELIVQSNNMKGTILKQGTLTLANEDANYTGPGNEVIFQGGTLNMYDNMNSYTDNCPWNIVVNEGQIGTINLDSRSSLSGSLTGDGTLNLFAPWVRNEIKGNWSQFTGTIHVSTDNDGGWFIVSNKTGFDKATVELDDDVQMIYGKSENVEIPVGAISGNSGAFLGAGGSTSNKITWKVGGNNTDAIFDGTINNSQYKNSGASASIIKTGTGSWTLTGSNSYTGPTTIEQGTLVLNNQSGSATGTGNITCKNGAFLGGTGSVTGSVTIESGGTFIPGYVELASFKIEGNLTLNENAITMIDVNTETKASDLTDVSGEINLNGTLILSKRGTAAYAEGEAFQLFKATTINGTFTTIYPTSPGDGLTWDTSKLNTQGILLVDKATAVDDKITTSSNQVFPNPFKNELSIQTSGSLHNPQIKLFNLQGKEIQINPIQVASNKWTINTNHLQNGQYIVSYLDDKQIKQSKVVVKVK